MTWLVTGGAGYIGSHVVRALREADAAVVVIDDLSTGLVGFVPEDVPLVRANLLDGDTVRTTLDQHGVRGVIHIAGYKYAGESVQRPLHTYRQNVSAMVTLLDAVTEAGIDKFVFSSSAATYGTPDTDLVDETTPTAPESPYGESKLIGEWLLRDTAVAAPGFRHTSLRYFNVVGSGRDELFDVSPFNLFPKVFDMLHRGQTPRINGADYPTPDGTCVRDYVHVTDLAAAHVAAARALDDGVALAPVYNLGSGDGTSVREIMTAIREVTGIDFEPEVAERRPGDPARIVAAGELAARDLDWRMRHSLTDMVASAWAARQHAGDAYPG
ncbi:UDP-glucose 4-epimerase GalE [Mycolicibacterium chitae]|uniref:UDP-glucose 4-epimerase n=1 Tax=Mycolicibacterium chitae TaxID=1792 RepID=A0A448HXQ1_MYCCI|nr:UDP-glucose 4-epimerase GalE [Mycolicibacterium chitae]MCV7107251.1 UDP-glucose 4-epimerase GalE [Mycolicibacterium chitae]BBZ02423.1 UDP-glucose 4-epimerase GalE [Mycolicibacterium chitae]VEG44970.1 UDP-glucose 4-epimerase [Mycolicibacterium chitae]